MTDQELHDYSREHLYYELWMLHETASRLVNDPNVRTDVVMKNAFIESFTVHTRALARFLYPASGVKQDGDVTADDYVADVVTWMVARGGTPPVELKAAIKRTGKEIVHLTTQRLPAGAPEKVWSPEAIFRAFCLPLHVFAKHVPAGRLDVSVRAFIGELPLPPKERAAPPIAAGTTTIAESVVFFDRPTDVSTP